MTVAEGIKVVRSWPEDRSAPRRLRDLIQAARGEERRNLQLLVEPLIRNSVTEADNDLVRGYFGAG